MPVARYGGRPVNDVNQTEASVAFPANAALSDRTVDVAKADFMSIITRTNFNPSTPVVGDSTVAVIPNVDAAFWTAGAPIPRVGQSAAVSGTIVYRIETYDVRAFSSVRLRYTNAHATQAAVLEAWITTSIRQGA